MVLLVDDWREADLKVSAMLISTEDEDGDNNPRFIK